MFRFAPQAYHGAAAAFSLFTVCGTQVSSSALGSGDFMKSKLRNSFQAG
jgi:hypothetical protein